MDARRRTTLMSEGGPFGNAMPTSSMAPPPSAMKKPAGRLGRPSMIPQPANRLSVMPAHPPALSHSTSQEQLRRSTMANQNGTSGARGDGGSYGRTSQPNRMAPGSVRRSSVFTATGRQSMAPGAFAAAGALQRDLRPIKDRNYQQQLQANIADYLAAARCPLPIIPRMMQSPTLKEFQTIFKFLVQDYTDATSFGKKWEDDALGILKDLRYPNMEGMGKTAFSAPGSPSHWLYMTAMLNWLVELNKAHERWRDPQIITDPLLQEADELPTDHPLLEDRAFWDYSRTTYHQWYAENMEEWQQADADFESIYDRLAQASYQEVEQLDTEMQKRTVELKQLQAQEPPLKRLEEEYLQLVSDQTKFYAFMDMHRQKADKLRIGTEKGRARIIEHEQQLDQLRADLARTEEAVSAQNLSPDEVQRMNHERETLSRNLEDLRVKIAEASQQAYDQEMQVTKSMDRFEALISDYTALGHQIGTIPALLDTPGPALGPDGVDYNIDLDLGMDDVNELIAGGKKLRGVIWPGLQSFSEKIRREVMELDNQKIVLDDELDKRSQEADGMRDEAAVRQTRLNMLQNQAEDLRAALQKATLENNETQRKLETEVNNIKEESSQGMYKHQAALEEKRIQFEELRHRTTQLQDSMVSELSRHIDVIIKAKEHTANSLKGLRSFAESHC